MQKQLDQAGITVLGGEEAVKEIGNLKKAPSPKHEYGNRTLTLEIVRSLDEAVDHIHSFGSGHTEAIITGARTCKFLNFIGSHGVVTFVWAPGNSPF